MKRIATHQRGAIDGWMISTIGLIVLVLGAGSLAIWALLNYQEQKTNVEGKVAEAVALAKKEQAEEDEVKFAEREKEPRREFVGPDDYGRIAFTYPKTWSVYLAKDAVKGGDYEVYLHPIQIPSLDYGEDQRFAVRFQILNQDYNSYIEQYADRVKEGKLRSTTISVNGDSGIRFDGSFTEKIRGAIVVFKIRDKTVVFKTDADTFKPDFDALIKTITFVK